jgi:cell division protein FtsW
MEKTIRYDYIIIAITLFLTLLGLATLYSASYQFASRQPLRFSTALGPISGNFIVILLMVVLFPVLASIDLKFLKKGAVLFILLFSVAVLNTLPFLPFFRNTGANTETFRWIYFKNSSGQILFSFQPSELIKLALPLYLAYILDKNKDRLNNFFYGFLPPAFITAVFCTLVLLQSNLSDAVFILFISLVICFVAGIGLLYYALAFGIIIPVGHRLIFGNKEGRWYDRLIGHSSLGSDPFGRDYQITTSLNALRTGGFFGKGIGQGTLKIILPEVHGDFVFASYAEESGFLGVLLYFLIIGVFAFICYKIAWQSKSRYNQLLIFGLATPIVCQTMLNIAVVAKIVPTTGIPLPFVSSGGSSLLVTLVSTAILVNIIRQTICMEGKYAG